MQVTLIDEVLRLDAEIPKDSGLPRRLYDERMGTIAPVLARALRAVLAEVSWCPNGGCKRDDRDACARCCVCWAIEDALAEVPRG